MAAAMGEDSKMDAQNRPLALVTGGLRRVGAHLAASLAGQGYDLALHGHSSSDIPDNIAQNLNIHGGKASVFQADFADIHAVEKLMADIIARWDKAPDLLVNNASLFVQDKADDMTGNMLQKHMVINMMAPVILSTQFIQWHKKNCAGENGRAENGAAKRAVKPSIVHILDQRIRNPNGDQFSYTLSKQALAASVKTLAMSAGHIVRVNGIAPGLTMVTPDYSAAQTEKVRNAMPLHNLPNPDDLAAALQYLVNAQKITGQIIFVDSGAHLKSFARDFLFL